ncbi:MAG: glycosyltransferase family 4 protein [Pseudomonadota bacterium]|nr:glycosyltransferase family 4 protein [Pseudomonadota bacterium]
MKRLAIVRQRYTPYGGAEVFVERAIDALLERGVSIMVITRRWSGAPRKGVEVTTVDPFHLGRTTRQQGFARAVCALLSPRTDLLVQSHERIACCDIYRAGDGVHAVWLEEKTRGARSLARTLTYLDPFHRYALAAERRLYASKRLKAVICISRMVQDEVHAHFGIPRERLPIIYNAIDSAVFHPDLRRHREVTRRAAAIGHDAVVFLLVGSGYVRKGAATALRALAQTPANARLVIVGKDRHEDRYRRLARSLGVERRVTFAGPQSDPKPWYGAADAFILPTLYDPLSNAVLEAMACGLPVITSHRCGAGELVSAHNAGTLCDSRDVPAHARAMTALLDPSLRQRQGRAARNAVLPLTPQAMAGELIALYERLLVPA